MQTILILDKIRSAQNVGAIFRTADGAGVEKIYLAGYTPSPEDRFGRVQPAIAKTSLGATDSVAWEVVVDDDVVDLLKQYQKDGWQVVAVEQSDNSVLLNDFKREDKVIYILGNEIDGVSAELQEQADTILEIPMKGEKESLNVSVTTGIVLFHH